MKRILSILFYLFIIVVCFITVYISNDLDYIFEKNVIKDSKSYNKYKDYKYVVFNIDNLEETRFQTKSESDKLTIYIGKYNDKYVLFKLTESTVKSGNIRLMKMKDDSISFDLKETYKLENEDIKFYSGYYTNKNVRTNEYFILAKLIGIGLFFIISVIGLIKNVFKK